MLDMLPDPLMKDGHKEFYIGKLMKKKSKLMKRAVLDSAFVRRSSAKRKRMREINDQKWNEADTKKKISCRPERRMASRKRMGH